jgi:hypothetical protein
LQAPPESVHSFARPTVAQLEVSIKMAQTKNRTVQQPSRSEELPVAELDVAPSDGDLVHIRFAFGVWFAVFSLLAASILWDSVYGLLFRSPPG